MEVEENGISWADWNRGRASGHQLFFFFLFNLFFLASYGTGGLKADLGFCCSKCLLFFLDTSCGWSGSELFVCLRFKRSMVSSGKEGRI